MLGRVFIIVVVGSLAPVGGCLAFVLQHRFQGSSLNVRRDFHTGKVEEGGSEVHIHADCIACASRLDGFGVADDKRHALAFLVHEALVEPAVFAEEEALVGSVDDDCIVQLSGLFKIVQKAADIFVHRQHGSQVVAHVLLVFPTD